MVEIQCSVLEDRISAANMHDFEVASATTEEKVKQLAAAGFEKVNEIYAIHVFRRPKRFRKR